MNSLTIKQFIALTMKISFLFVIVALLNPLFASTAKAQKLDEVSINLSVKNASLEEIIETIEVQTPFNFVYGRTVSKIKNRYSLRYRNVSLRSVLELLAKDAGLAFRRIDENISIDKRDKTAVAVIEETFKEIKGTVVDENGQPLPGASVVESGTTNGTATDFDGNFTLEVAPDAILEVSYIGYATQYVEINERAELIVQLELTSSSLQEVVLIGYGQQALWTNNWQENSPV